MTWTTKNKEIRLESTTSHLPSAKPGIKGRAPTNRAIRFTPQELFGAMARCSHLHPVSPAAVTFESEGCRHLIALHVDDRSDDFFILPTVKRLKDFSRTHLLGVVGAGIAYLQMIRDGYVWCDHFENLDLSSPPPTKRAPDFVFNQPGEAGVAIMESKATNGSSRTRFSDSVRRGYLTQVEPYLGLGLSGAVASHGFSIGSWMTSTTRAELVIEHTAQLAHVAPTSAPGTPRGVRRGNYLTALSLMFGPAVAAAARAGAWPSSETRLVTTRWLDRDWLLGSPLQPPTWLPWIVRDTDRVTGVDWSARLSDMVFALELNVADVVFRSLTSPSDAPDPLDDLVRIDDALVERGIEAGCAVYPDGFALIGTDDAFEKIRRAEWDPQSGAIVESVATQSAEVNSDSACTEPTELCSQVTEEDDEKVEEQQSLRLTLDHSSW